MIWTDSAIPNKAAGREDMLPSLAPQERERGSIGFFLPYPSLQRRGTKWAPAQVHGSSIMSRHDDQTFLSEFRGNLEAFYAALKLAPPYDSVEKTVRCLDDLFKARTAEEQAQVLGDNTLKWQLHVQAFVNSGLHKKHRGIITGLAHTDAFDRFPESLRYLLEPFRS